MKISPIPLLFIHGDSDRAVPSQHSQLLYQAAAIPKQLWIIPQGQHINAAGSTEFRRKLVDYLQQAPQ